MSDKYTVYLHVFPDGKRYVGCTCRPLKARWDGGLGYVNCPRMYDAIVRVGWENVEHYTLSENMDREIALLLEASLIKRWRTYLPSNGYNIRTTDVDGLSNFVVPRCRKKRVSDTSCGEVHERYKSQVVKRKASPSKQCKRIRLVETGEVFNSLTDAAEAFFVTASALCDVVNKPNRTCGTCMIHDPDEGWTMEVRAHWEYID